MKQIALVALCILTLIIPTSGAQLNKSWSLWWFFYFNLPLKSRQGTLTFDFPENVNQPASYLLMPARDNTGTSTSPLPGPLPLGGSITVTAQITKVHGNPIFRYDTEPDNTCIFPAHVRPYIARRNYDGYANYDRWWSNPIAIELVPNMMSTITTPLDPAQWSSVYGHTGDSSLEAMAGFQAALNDPGDVGLSMGGGCFYGHGVYVSGGSAQFVLLNYQVSN